MGSGDGNLLRATIIWDLFQNPNISILARIIEVVGPVFEYLLEPPNPFLYFFWTVDSKASINDKKVLVLSLKTIILFLSSPFRSTSITKVQNSKLHNSIFKCKSFNQFTINKNWKYKTTKFLSNQLLFTFQIFDMTCIAYKLLILCILCCECVWNKILITHFHHNQKLTLSYF